MRGAGEEGLSVAAQMSRRALLTGAFRSAASEDVAPGPPGEAGAPRSRDGGARLSAEQRPAALTAELDRVLEQMNGPTGFEDLEVREA